MIEDKQMRHLIAVGKERGYLLYKEVNDSLSAEVHSSEEIDDLLSTFERYGVNVYEDATSAEATRDAAEATDFGAAETKEELPTDDGELDLTPGTLEKTNDPVRSYLREMGNVPLLTRESEVAHREAHRARASARSENHYTRSADSERTVAGWRRPA